MFRLVALLSALALQSAAMAAEPSALADRVGDTYEIRRKTVTETSSDRTSGSSQSGGLLVERVIAIESDGVQLEFDLPKSTPEDQRTPEWQFPVRVLRSTDGALTLLNRPELEARNQRWLKLAKLTPEACGRWMFTWTAFKIECDPRSVLSILAAYDLRLGVLMNGPQHSEAGGLGSAPLHQERTGPTGATFVTEVEVDPEAVRRERAEMDVVVAQISGGPTKTLDDALQARAAERISGKIVIRFETDGVGQVTRRVQVTSTKVQSSEGLEEMTTTETTERRLLSRSK